ADDGCAELLQAPGVAGMTDERADRDIILRSEGLRGVRADEAGRTRQQYGFRRHSTGSKLVSRATKGNGLSRFRGSEARSYRSLDDVQGSLELGRGDDGRRCDRERPPVGAFGQHEYAVAERFL